MKKENQNPYAEPPVTSTFLPLRSYGMSHYHLVICVGMHETKAFGPDSKG